MCVYLKTHQRVKLCIFNNPKREKVTKCHEEKKQVSQYLHKNLNGSN